MASNKIGLGPLGVKFRHRFLSKGDWFSSDRNHHGLGLFVFFL